MRILLDNLIILVFAPIWFLVGFRLDKVALKGLKEEAARYKDVLITRAYEVLNDVNRKELQAQVNIRPKRESV